MMEIACNFINEKLQKAKECTQSDVLPLACNDMTDAPSIGRDVMARRDVELPLSIK